MKFRQMLQSWTKLLRQNKKLIFQQKNPSSPQINVACKVLDF